MRYFQIPKWDEYQHYADRAPKWIKLHAKILENYEFSQLSDVNKCHLILIWLLASRMNNRMPWDEEWVRRQIGSNEDVDLDILSDFGFIEESEPSRDEVAKWPSRYVNAKLRLEVLARDNNSCQSCGSTENLEIDHVIPTSRGGTSVAENLQVLCRRCNRKKRSRISLRSTSLQQTQGERSEVEQSAGQPRSLEGETEIEGEVEHTPRARAGEVDLFADSFDGELQAFMKKLKATYPFRAPTTPGKNRWDRAAVHAKAHVVAGRTTYADILEAVKRYRLYCEAREQIGTQFVEMAGNFIRDIDNIANEWEPPTRKLTRAEQAEQEQRQILNEMKERDADA